jgi:hypothetical protein
MKTVFQIALLVAAIIGVTMLVDPPQKTKEPVISVPTTNPHTAGGGEPI